MTQNNQILDHLKKGNSVTPLEALNLFGCWRLAARIKDLRDIGHRIETTTVPVGNDKWVASYSLIQVTQ